MVVFGSVDRPPTISIWWPVISMPARAGSELSARPEPGSLLSLIVLVSLPSMAAMIAGSEQAAIAPYGAASPAAAAPKPNISDTRPATIGFLNIGSVPRVVGRQESSLVSSIG